MSEPYDYLVIGGGIIGLTIARSLKIRYPYKRVGVLEKEMDIAFHASGRNSGVLHAGFYYSADSLKAKFASDGNRAMRQYCRQHKLDVNPCGKLVVATDEEELLGLEELKRRADQNGVELIWMDEAEIAVIDPNARTYKKALYSPNTVTVDPVQVCRTIYDECLRIGIQFHFGTQYRSHKKDNLITNQGTFRCRYVVNAAGLYADRIAHDFGFGKAYTIIPFKGIYLKYEKNKSDVRTNIYPVPKLSNPFLGVHFTKTVDGSFKIGPTAIPAFWRENYSGLQRFNLMEFVRIVYYETKLFVRNSFGFRGLALNEMMKYIKPLFIKRSLRLVRQLDPKGFGSFVKPGIRAQLLHKKTLELVQDFLVEGDETSIHVLNAVSPAFTCSFPFAEYVTDLIAQKQGEGVS